MRDLLCRWLGHRIDLFRSTSHIWYECRRCGARTAYRPRRPKPR